ncbi:hypothetical protein BaRGS_00040134 [Batillaria attramentaria]|uniref:Uncharacterized protein n=1 Tax=Batillaria attramentaria TaxID=370345 RepID=A0ABD0J1B6_9CAEN
MVDTHSEICVFLYVPILYLLSVMIWQTWHNPLAPAHYTGNTGSQQEIIRDINRCPFFAKTGACRFGDRCSRVHVRPESSTILLIPGMFESFELRKSATDDYDTDMGLEYEDSELYHSFREFYSDVLPEFRSVGKVINFKVCCNHEPHLRGNVYIQYKRETDAQQAFAKFNARWYAGRQLSCEFVNISKWKSAICGLFFAKRCPKGKKTQAMNSGKRIVTLKYRPEEGGTMTGTHHPTGTGVPMTIGECEDRMVDIVAGTRQFLVGTESDLAQGHIIVTGHVPDPERGHSLNPRNFCGEKLLCVQNKTIASLDQHQESDQGQGQNRGKCPPDKDLSPLRRHKRRSPSREEDSDTDAASSRKRKYRSARSQSVSSENTDASEQDEHSKASSSSSKRLKSTKRTRNLTKRKRRKDPAVHRRER